MAPHARLVASCAFALLLVAPAAVAGDRSARPHQDTVTFAGLIACSVGFRPLFTRDLCNDEDLPLSDPNAQSRHRFRLEAGLTAASVTLSWEEGSGVNVGGTLTLTWVSPAGINPNQFSGRSPLVREYAFTREDSFTLQPTNATIEVRASAGGNIGSWNDASILVWQQRYDLCIVLYYHGAEDRAHDDPCVHFLE